MQVRGERWGRLLRAVPVQGEVGGNGDSLPHLGVARHRLAVRVPLQVNYEHPAIK